MITLFHFSPGGCNVNTKRKGAARAWWSRERGPRSSHAQCSHVSSCEIFPTCRVAEAGSGTSLEHNYRMTSTSPDPQPWSKPAAVPAAAHMARLTSKFLFHGPEGRCLQSLWSSQLCLEPLSLIPPDSFGFPVDGSGKGITPFPPGLVLGLGPRHHCLPSVRPLSSELCAANSNSSRLLVINTPATVLSPPEPCLTQSPP